mmetsp:Transcript_9713/g.14794  ORF Transcript_9713/g.14794 Transcript_9713/m.14794 type:complete len:92 (+) Transcript_9713:835-1110(+)|eukprot:CAMPEP_0170497656 /NCGR_PEP_ID=MMETSP0208-20121228/25357_1 /TAXON_ID=197538 /ORGANISM="Strombidium inclinatum, Strain S3" /LENGTH=91 /DNA_ID=CAMNT_0010774535 /DNA_START=771 /DNA_END=1046 /DNA_ORIENTATION=+
MSCFLNDKLCNKSHLGLGPEDVSFEGDKSHRGKSYTKKLENDSIASNKSQVSVDDLVEHHDLNDSIGKFNFSFEDEDKENDAMDTEQDATN